MLGEDKSIQFIKFALVGVVSTLTHMVTLIVMVELLGLPAVVGSVGGFLFAVIASYGLNSHWTFNSPRKESNGRFVRYFLVCLIGLGINTTLMYLFTKIIGIWYVLGQVFVIFFVTPINYTLNRLWAFKAERIHEDGESD